MDHRKRFFERPGGALFVAGVLLFVAGFAAGSRGLWIVGLALIAFGLATARERSGRK